MNRFKIAQYIAIGATTFSLIGSLLGGFSESNFGSELLCIGLFTGILSLLFAGLFKAIMMSFGVAKWGYMIMPYPICYLAYIVVLVFAAFFFVLFPIIPVRKAYKESIYYKKIGI